MNQRVSIALLTIVLVGAGYGAGLWTGKLRCKVPPAPLPLLGELAPKSEKNPAPAPAPEVTELARQLERLRPQIEEFRAQMDTIDRELDARIDAILRPDQRVHFLELVKRGEQFRAREDAESKLTTPLTKDELREIQRRPLQQMLSIVVVPIRVYWNTKQLNLDETQKCQLTEILQWRRAKFLELIDRSPPPSLELSTLAHLAKRLGAAEKPAK